MRHSCSESIILPSYSHPAGSLDRVVGVVVRYEANNVFQIAKWDCFVATHRGKVVAKSISNDESIKAAILCNDIAPHF